MYLLETNAGQNIELQSSANPVAITYTRLHNYFTAAPPYIDA
jgi:hypothetical protein